MILHAALNDDGEAAAEGGEGWSASLTHADMLGSIGVAWTSVS